MNRHNNHKYSRIERLCSRTITANLLLFTIQAYASLIFTVLPQPLNAGMCSISPTSGTVTETKWKVDCSSWKQTRGISSYLYGMYL